MLALLLARVLEDSSISLLDYAMASTPGPAKMRQLQLLLIVCYAHSGFTAGRF